MKREELTRSQKEGLLSFMLTMQTTLDDLVRHFNLPFKLGITVENKDDKFFTREIRQGTFGVGLDKELKDLLIDQKESDTP